MKPEFRRENPLEEIDRTTPRYKGRNHGSKQEQDYSVFCKIETGQYVIFYCF